MDRILSPGRNCWRIEPAHRVRLLVDGAAYFGAFRSAAKRARRSIFIVGWDVNSRTRLVRGDPEDDLPAELGAFLNALARRRRELHVHVLDWDFAMLYATDRELLPIYKLGWRTHRRVHFHLDGRHPVGGSHHQKIVVIDDALAFVGGLDLTKGRWDTPAHRPGEPDRRLPEGRDYPPFHDLQLMVEGRVAKALGELARERWRRATGQAPEGDAGPGGEDLWPPGLTADLEQAMVGISRTEPAYEDRPEVQEVKGLYLDAIAAARRWIYLENQYFTAHAVGEALAARLREPDGPEVVVVTRVSGDGWLERNTMTVLRARLLRRLAEADVHGRLRVYYPQRDDLDGQPIRLHSKLMVVDDRLLRVGSANLNNRSMGLDSECDLAVEATDPRTRGMIRGLLGRLLAEHLGASTTRVAGQLAEGRALGEVIESLRGGPRSLEPLPAELAPELDALVPEEEVIDPEQSVDPGRLAEEILPGRGGSLAGLRLTAMAALLATLGALAAAWRWTPLGEWLDMDALLAMGEMIRASPAAPLWVLTAYIVACLVALPITLLILLTVLTFGPLAGFAYGLSGSLLAAVLTYWLGWLLGRDAVRHLTGPRLNALSRRIARQGLLAVVAVRVIPVAPFTVVNLVAGASHIRFRDFVLGTLLGMTPGILAVTVFADRIGAVIREPSLATLALLAAAALLILFAALRLGRWLRRRQAGQGTGEAA